MTDDTRASRSARTPIYRDVQRPLLARARQRQAQQERSRRVGEPPARGHHLGVRPRAVDDRPRSTSRHDDTVKGVNNIGAAQPVDGHTAGKGFRRGHRLVADVIGQGSRVSGHARDGAGQGCSHTTCAQSRQIRRTWGRLWRTSALSRQIWHTAPHRGAGRSGAGRGGRATRRACARRSSCSRGRSGTSRGRAPESTSCRTAPARACR